MNLTCALPSGSDLTIMVPSLSAAWVLQAAAGRGAAPGAPPRGRPAPHGRALPRCGGAPPRNATRMTPQLTRRLPRPLVPPPAAARGQHALTATKDQAASRMGGCSEAGAPCYSIPTGTNTAHSAASP